jgi:RHS repeat-associated protein
MPPYSILRSRPSSEPYITLRKTDGETWIEVGLNGDAKSIFTSDADGFGNVIEEKSVQTGNAKEYTYRADGKLISFQDNLDMDRDRGFDSCDKRVATTNYYFDALDRRIAKKISQKRGYEGSFGISYSHLGDRDQILIGKNGNGELTIYLDGQKQDEHLGQVSINRAHGYATDHLGSVLNTKTSGGRQKFGAFGEQLGGVPLLSRDSDPAMYGFTGRSLDPESRMYYYRGRDYDPVSARFISKDPIGFKSRDLNLYRYVKNNPLGKRDPLGLCPDLSDLNNPFGYGSIPDYFSPDANATMVGGAAGMATALAMPDVAAAGIATAMAAPEASAALGAALLTYAPDAATAVDVINASASATAQYLTNSNSAPESPSSFWGYIIDTNGSNVAGYLRSWLPDGK